MGCRWSQLDDVVGPSPNDTAKPPMETGKPLIQNRPTEPCQNNPAKPCQTKVTTNGPKTTNNGSRLHQQDSASVKETLRRLVTQRDKSLSPIYHQLPKKAQKCFVKSIYDGDTLTLNNHKRVRFLGIDTPELKNPTQAFSEEAKAYTVKRCGGEHAIWISYEEGHDTEDRYGRLLCWVWVQVGDGKYECVNEGLVKMGLASVYVPSKGAKLHNISKLIAMQKAARIAKQGMWSNFQDYEVVKTKNGIAFHHRNQQCDHLKRSTNLTPMLASIAMDEGRHACRTCLAD